MGLLGILVGLGLLIFLSYRSWSVLLVALLAALIAALAAGEPLLAHWTRPSWAVPPNFSRNSSRCVSLAPYSARSWRTAARAPAPLDSLPHNGAVVTLLAVCGMTHRESYRDIVMVAIVSALLALAAVIVLGSIFGSF
jgi:H+/gluconate symporter-like permease